MTDIATITLRANVSDIQSAGTELDKFAGKADGAAKSADHLSDEMDQVHKRVAELRQRMLTTESATKKNADSQDALAESFLKQISGIRLASDANAKLMNISKLMREERKAGNLDNGNYLELLSQISRRTRELSDAEQLASAKREVFLKKLKDQVAVQSLSRTELLRFQAAQLGAGSAASKYIDLLDKSSASTHSLGLKSAAARREIGILFGEVARGNFGALRGSSITLANRAGWIDKLMTLRGLGIATVVGGIAAAVYGLGKAWYEGSKEATEFNKQLILTGNYAGKTASQLQSLSKSLSGNGVTQQAVAEALAKVVGSGKFRGDQLETVTRAAVAMERATGQSVDKTIANFEKLYASPTKSSEELNKQLHYLTASQFQYISSLERRGDKEAAGQAAADAYSKAEQSRSQQIIENLGLVERAIKSATDRWKGFWDAALNVGRPTTELSRLQGELDVVNETIAKTRSSRERYGGLSILSDKTLSAQIARSKELQTTINFIKKSQEGYNQAQADSNKINNDGIEAQIVINKYMDAGTTATEKRALAQKELNKAIADNAKAAKAGTANLWSNDDIAKARAGIDKLFKDPKTPKTKGYTTFAGDRTEDSARSELLALQAQLKVLQQHKDVNDKISQQRKDLWTTEAKFQVLEESARTRQLSKQEQSLLASKDQVIALAQQKAELGDQIVAQEKLNSLMDSAQKLRRQQESRSAGIKLLAGGASARDAQREEELERIRKEYSLNPEAQKEALALMRQSYDERDALEKNWSAGAINGLNEYLQTATDVYSSMSSVAQSALGGISDMMTSLVTTGTASFKQFAASILKMIVEIINKLLVAWAVQQAMGWIAGSFGGGGSTPSGAYTSAAANVSFDTGGYTGDGGKHEPKGVVHGGEFVFTKAATSAIGIDNLYAMMRGAQGYADGGFVGKAPMYGMNNGTGSGNAAPVINTIVNVEANGNASAQTSSSGDAMGRALAEEMQNAATMVVQKHLKPGGMIYNFSKGR